MLRRLHLAIVVAVLALGASLVFPPASGAQNPSGYTGDFPDPAILYAEGSYWAYGTNTAGLRVPVMRSSDLMNWTLLGDALGAVPPWAAGFSTLAPGIAHFGDRYVLYYSALEVSTDRMCVSAATAASPAGPFVDSSAGPLVCQRERGGTIDPSPYVAPDGTPYLLYKSEGIANVEPTRIWIRRLTGDGLGFVGAETMLLETLHWWEQPVIENPAFVDYGGRLYLIYSANRWYSQSYATGYAVCDTPTGPCRRPTNTPLLSTRGNLRGPGGSFPIVDQRGRLLFAHHAWTGGGTRYRNGDVRSLHFVEVAVLGDLLVPIGAPSFGDSIGRSGDVVAADGSDTGYRLVDQAGAVACYGDSPCFGGLWGLRLNAPIVAAAGLPSDRGYWLMGGDGGVFSFGDAAFHGSTGGLVLNQPIVTALSTPTGNGYWLVASDGGVFSFGDAAFHGSTGGLVLNQPITAAMASASGLGYHLVARDGGVFSFGDAAFHGAGSDIDPFYGVTAAVRTSGGYRLVTEDALVLPFGTASYLGGA